MGTKGAIFSRRVESLLENNKVRLLFFIILYLTCYTSNSLYGQTHSLSEKDRKGIQNRAQLLLNEYKNLLNNISSNAMYPEEVQLIIQNSYQGEASKIFENADVIIEDDLMPQFNGTDRPKNPKNISIKAYLRKFDLLYLDTDQPSVEFSNIAVSKVFKEEYVYAQVRFNCLFKSKNKINTNKSFSITDRVLEIRAFKKNKRWNAFITSVSFWNDEFSQKSPNIKKDAYRKKDPEKILPQNNSNGIEEVKPKLVVNSSKNEDTITENKVNNDKNIKSIKKNQTINPTLSSSSTDNKSTSVLEAMANSYFYFDKSNLVSEEYKIFEAKILNAFNNKKLLYVSEECEAFYSPRLFDIKNLNYDSNESQNRIKNEAVLAILWRAKAEYELQNYKNALTESEKVLSLASKNKEALFQKSLALIGLRKYNQASNNLLFLLGIGANEILIFLKLSDLYKIEGKYDEGKKILFQYISRYGLNSEVCYQLGEIYELEENKDQAIDYYTRSFETDSTTYKSLFKIAHLLINKKEFVGAVEFLKFKGSENEQIKGYRYYQLIGRAELYQRNFNVSLEYLSKAYQIKSTDSQTLIDLAMLNFAKKNENVGYRYVAAAFKTGEIQKSNIDGLELPSVIKKSGKFKLIVKTYLD